jgi:hypothetical protein
MALSRFLILKERETRIGRAHVAGPIRHLL